MFPDKSSDKSSIVSPDKSDKSPLTEEAVENLAIEYASLFIGPGSHLTPCESVWREGEGSFWGESTVQAKSFIEGTSGLRLRPDWSGLEEIISRWRYEFMARLCSHEADLWGPPERSRELHLCLETEESFPRAFFPNTFSCGFPHSVIGLRKEATDISGGWRRWPGSFLDRTSSTSSRPCGRRHST